MATALCTAKFLPLIATSSKTPTGSILARNYAFREGLTKGNVMKRYFISFLGVVLGALLLAGCGARDKGPAETALKAAEEALNVAKVEASKYLPDQMRSLESALAAAKEKFKGGDYQAVLAEGPLITSKAQELASAAAAKKEEFTKSWDGLSSGMQRVVEVIKSRVDTLSQSKKLPAGMSADAFAQAKSGL